MPVKTQSLVAVLVALLELVVGWRPWPAEDGQNVPPDACLVKGSISLALGELVRIHKLPRRFATGHQEDVVPHEGSRVEKAKDA